MGRKKQYTERLTLPIDRETLDRLDAVRGEDEPRLDVIRDAIDRELKRRERQKPAVEQAAEPSAKPFRFKLEQESYPVDWDRDAWENVKPHESGPIPITSPRGVELWDMATGIGGALPDRLNQQGFIQWVSENAPSAYFVEEWYQLEGKGGTDRCRWWLEIPNNAEAMLFSLRWKLPKDSSSDA